MPIRLLFLNTRDQCGADVSVHLTLMKNFSPDEVEVFVISNSQASDAQEMRSRLGEMPNVKSTFLPLGKPARALSGKSRPGKALAYLPSFFSLIRAAGFIRRNRIQIVHATDRPRDASYASLLGRMTRAISVVHMHAPVAGLSRPTLWGMRNASALLAVSESVRQDLITLGIGAHRIHTVHNAVDPDYFDPDWRPDTPRSIRAGFGIPSGAPMVGIAARMYL